MTLGQKRSGSSSGGDRVTAEAKELALQLFQCSPLKREKYARITKLLGDSSALQALDLGSDNGVISCLLRERGGGWKSADISSETVESIRSLVGEDVYHLEGVSLPFESAHFDCVVIVDLLEHVRGDRELCREIFRVLKPGGALIANVPNPKEGLIRKFRFLIGQTDEEHGHLRPGYTIRELNETVGEGFELEKQESYSRLFSILVDTLILTALHLLKGRSEGGKGTVVTTGDLQAQRKKLKLFSLIAPLLHLAVSLDKLVPFLHGNMLIARYRKAG